MRCCSKMLMLMVATFSLCAFGDGSAETPLTQGEFVAIMEKEAFRFVHSEDWLSWIRYIKNKGVSEEMIINAYSEIAKRNIHAPDGTDDAEKCRKSINAIHSLAPTMLQLSNVVYVAEHAASVSARREAIWAYYTRTKGTELFLDFADRALTSTNLLQGAESKLMSCLCEDAEAKRAGNSSWHRKISRMMRRYVANDASEILCADQILMIVDADYVYSPLHRNVRTRILKPEYKNFIEKKRGGFAVEVIKRYQQEEQKEKAK